MASIEDDRQALYSIGAVCRMLDVAPATVRNWEDRYGIITPQRSAGGHRLYSRSDVERLRFVVERLEQGLQPAEAHSLLAERLEQGLPLVALAARDSRRLLILLAERDPLAAQLDEYSLRTEGYEVACALEAREARSLFVQLKPQVEIVDLLISRGSGLALCRELKSAGLTALVAVSALATRDEALEAGADAFLRKPIDPLQLVSTVRDLLRTSSWLSQPAMSR
jgi:DNA-binding transcriptional MerR regulator